MLDASQLVQVSALELVHHQGVHVADGDRRELERIVSDQCDLKVTGICR